MQKYGSKNVALLIPPFIILLKESICTFKYFFSSKDLMNFSKYHVYIIERNNMALLIVSFLIL